MQKMEEKSESQQSNKNNNNNNKKPAFFVSIKSMQQYIYIYMYIGIYEKEKRIDKRIRELLCFLRPASRVFAQVCMAGLSPLFHVAMVCLRSQHTHIKKKKRKEKKEEEARYGKKKVLKQAPHCTACWEKHKQTNDKLKGEAAKQKVPRL